MKRYDEACETFNRAANLAKTEEDHLNAFKFAAESARKSGNVDMAPAPFFWMRWLMRRTTTRSCASWPGWKSRPVKRPRLGTGSLSLDSDPDVETRLFLIKAEDFHGDLRLLNRQLEDVGDDEILRRQLIETKFNPLVSEERYDAAFAVLETELESVSDIAYLVILLQKKANLHTQLDECIAAASANQELLGYINDSNVLLSPARSFELGGDLQAAA